MTLGKAVGSFVSAWFDRKEESEREPAREISPESEKGANNVSVDLSVYPTNWKGNILAYGLNWKSSPDHWNNVPGSPELVAQARNWAQEQDREHGTGKGSLAPLYKESGLWNVRALVSDYVKSTGESGESESESEPEKSEKSEPARPSPTLAAHLRKKSEPESEPKEEKSEPESGEPAKKESERILERALELVKIDGLTLEKALEKASEPEIVPVSEEEIIERAHEFLAYARKETLEKALERASYVHGKSEPVSRERILERAITITKGDLNTLESELKRAASGESEPTGESESEPVSESEPESEESEPVSSSPLTLSDMLSGKKASEPAKKASGEPENKRKRAIWLFSSENKEHAHADLAFEVGEHVLELPDFPFDLKEKSGKKLEYNERLALTAYFSPMLYNLEKSEREREASSLATILGVTNKYAFTGHRLNKSPLAYFAKELHGLELEPESESE